MVTILTCYQKGSMKWLDLSQFKRGSRQCPVALDGSLEKKKNEYGATESRVSTPEIWPIVLIVSIKITTQ